MASGGESRWEFWFKTVLSALLAVVAFIGIQLWNHTDALDVTVTSMASDLRVETQARADLAGKVDELSATIKSLNDTLSGAQPPPMASAPAELSKKIDHLSGQMWSLQGQLDSEAAARNGKLARRP